MLALMFFDLSWELMASRVSCRVAPGSMLTLYSEFDWEMVSVVDSVPLLTTLDAPPANTAVETFEAVASLVTSRA
ncbi:hypothetical protein D9M71_742300 [compost metagenome]